MRCWPETPGPKDRLMSPTRHSVMVAFGSSTAEPLGKPLGSETLMSSAAPESPQISNVLRLALPARSCAPAMRRRSIRRSRLASSSPSKMTWVASPCGAGCAAPSKRSSDDGTTTLSGDCRPSACGMPRSTPDRLPSAGSQLPLACRPTWSPSASVRWLSSCSYLPRNVATALAASARKSGRSTSSSLALPAAPSNLRTSPLSTRNPWRVNAAAKALRSNLQSSRASSFARRSSTSW
mmetsp:Transcript_49676/g.142117  ORF Transcript_49676/g.142117 Transcript_49676/m.142117 type:complete len:237 (+) Transcript_49676:2971-3681(+)